MTARPFLAAVLAGGLFAGAGCNPSGLHSVDTGGDTSASDTGSTAPVVGLLVRPDRVDVPVGGTVQLHAIGLRDDRTTSDLTTSTQWVSGDPTIASLGDTGQEGVVTGVGAGQIPVFASRGSVDAPAAEVTVTSGTLEGILASPGQLTVPKGGTARLQAEAVYDDGSSGDASTQVIWTVADPTVATMGSDGSLNALAVGATTVHAQLGSMTSADVAVSVVDGQQPDLVVSSLQTEASESSMRVDVGVTNQGTVGAPLFWVDLFVDPAQTPTAGSTGDASQPIFYLDPGQTAHVAFKLNAAAGSHAVWAVADSGQAVTESDETNNTDQASVQVGGASEDNLSLRYFDATSSSTGAVYLVEVSNTGNEAVGPFWVDLWYDAGQDPSVDIQQHGAPCVGDNSQHVDLLGAGESTWLSFAVSASDLGCTACTSWVMADTCNDVQEHYEDDNVGGPLTVDIP